MDSHFLRSIIDRANQGEELTFSNVNDSEPLVMVNPSGDVEIDVEENAEVVILCCAESEAEVSFNLSYGVKLSVVTLLLSPSKSKVNVNIAQDALCNITSIDVAGADSQFDILLGGKGGDAELNILQLTTAKDHSIANATIRHESSDCTSRSMGKCVASGSSVGEFHGLVYVAKDAQRTSSEQNSRNIQLSADAKIIAEPQLEIYADDVKCTHGATVGQMNDEAIFYMMQRGLSRDLAQKLHLEGFVDDIVNRCSIASLMDELKVMVEDRLHQI
ncbi:MAG: SufD family Fe-S cluster assembly protein [Rikenellaceae bacterium]